MATEQGDLFGKERISTVLRKIAPPVMLAQLIQSLYNLVDSFFVGLYSGDGLTALSVIYPLQLVAIALAVGTGVGVNTYMARAYAHGEREKAESAAGMGMLLSLVSWVVFAAVSAVIMPAYVRTSCSVPQAVHYAEIYGYINCVGSIGVFLEGNWTKVHQSRGNMRRPMVAQIAGAVINIIFDPILIFGAGMGVAGAALATVIGQVSAALIVAPGAVCRPPKAAHIWHYVKRIYYFGYSSIFMQLLYTVYILALNMILAGFSDAAVTVLGLYYKWQSLFFVPLFGLQTCIVPVLSYNYAIGQYDRCRQTMRFSFLISAAFMVLGMVGFILFPEQLLRVFSDSAEVIAIGKVAFPIIGSGFISAVFGLIMPSFFQALGMGLRSAFLALLRQLICLVPIFWAFSLIGLDYTWLSFPISETVSGAAGLLLYALQLRKWKREKEAT